MGEVPCRAKVDPAIHALHVVSGKEDSTITPGNLLESPGDAAVCWSGKGVARQELFLMCLVPPKRRNSCANVTQRDDVFSLSVYIQGSRDAFFRQPEFA